MIDAISNNIKNIAAAMKLLIKLLVADLPYKASIISL